MAVKRRYEMGAGGFCIRPKCGEKVGHRSGIPCQEERCPSCGAKMLREDSHHHRLFKEKQAKKRQKSSESSEAVCGFVFHTKSGNLNVNSTHMCD